MIKKIILNTYLFFRLLFSGLKKADDLFSAKKSSQDGNGSMEQQYEADSVYNDMIRGEVTQEVKELRHEMYYAERKSHHYIYNGEDRGELRQVLDYSGHIENSDNHKVWIVQENKEDTGSLIENLQDDFKNKNHRSFTIQIERDFIPSFRLEEFINKIVVKSIDENKCVLDLYTSQYMKQFMTRHRPFIAELNRIYEGDTRSPLLQFNSLEFVTSNAYGADDLMLFKFINPEFVDILKFDGNFVLRYAADININGFDIIKEFYDEDTQKKSDNKEMRKNAVFDFNVAQQKIGTTD